MENKYHCTQDALYEGADLLAESLEEELGQFGFKAKYTQQFVDDLRDEIEAARNLPDEEARTAESGVKRVALVNFTDTTVKQNVNALRLYIRDAVTNPETRRIRMAEAGFNDYEEAMHYNWEKLKGMMNSGNNFITAHSAELLANNNMPASFPATFTAIKQQVDTDVIAMLNTRENTKAGTQDKIAANNTLHDHCIDICEDGQHVFVNDEARRSQFVWDSIQQIITPPGVAGVRITIKEEGTNFPLQGVTITIQQPGGTPLEQTTDANGKAAFIGLEAGAYNGTIVKPGYETKAKSGEIKTGVISFYNTTLVKIP